MYPSSVQTLWLRFVSTRGPKRLPAAPWMNPRRPESSAVWHRATTPWAVDEEEQASTARSPSTARLIWLQSPRLISPILVANERRVRARGEVRASARASGARAATSLLRRRFERRARPRARAPSLQARARVDRRAAEGRCSRRREHDRGEVDDRAVDTSTSSRRDLGGRARPADDRRRGNVGRVRP
jgi:hypothetical protein